MRQQRQVESAFLDEVVCIHVEDKPKSEHEEEKTTSKKPRPEKLMIIGGLRSYRESETRGWLDCDR